MTGLALFALAGRRLDHLEHRHLVLARNIANADTPNYRPLDVVAPDFGAMLRGTAVGGPLQLARTSGGHLAGGSAPGPGRVVRTEGMVMPSGNAVSLEEEAGKLRETAGQHSRVTTLYGKYVGFLKLALGANA